VETSDMVASCVTILPTGHTPANDYLDTLGLQTCRPKCATRVLACYTDAGDPALAITFGILAHDSMTAGRRSCMVSRKARCPVLDWRRPSWVP
jgi:hypothetical protein